MKENTKKSTDRPLSGIAHRYMKPFSSADRCRGRAAGCFPRAVKIRLVQDNLSTHNASCFYKHPPAGEAFELAQRFEFYHSGSQNQDELLLLQGKSG